MSQAANKLRQAGMSGEVVDTLMEVLGNCQGTLVHRGPLTFASDMPNASFNLDDPNVADAGSYDTTTGDNYPPAALTVASDGVTGRDGQGRDAINGGFAIGVHGPIWLGGPIVFANGVKGIDAVVTVMTGFEVNGSGDGYVLHYKTLTFTKGVLTSVVVADDTTIAGESCS